MQQFKGLQYASSKNIWTWQFNLALCFNAFLGRTDICGWIFFHGSTDGFVFLGEFAKPKLHFFYKIVVLFS